MRRLASISLLCAWLCASSTMLDIAQVFAWTRMFAAYSGKECVLAAAKDTFDPQRPCAICRALSKAREAAAKHGPVAPIAGSEKLVMIFQHVECFVAAATEPGWSDAARKRATEWDGDVPLPPPKTWLA